ncbi:phenylalanine--tRNA ligase subunit alpha [Candidatus Phytoplasma sacchari]|uniref:Phenylalanine--tRNA ligase alpha subunit n=1 Tax=Candidatus Phytoplasma sacchari TaxID=2609813 RepID=A0ABY7M125_9MOLU|nr:phenylalanine--tRNA ligase subunit alpha [Candidatus Phytoplasma sacchari]KAB8122782.1 phenylalanine--tRNA ligase subunit alpha [Candidatus Phytoplasma sacchari]WBL31425.1 phenylalanine--tRNA ligase subunit alpha [Candidatus Phytoplasma sacchari]
MNENKNNLIFLEEKIKELEFKIKNDLKKAKNKIDLKKIEIQYLGKEGYIYFLLKEIKKQSLEMKKKNGNKINIFKKKVVLLIKAKINDIEKENLSYLIKKQKIDVTLPSFPFRIGSIHPLNKTIEEIEKLFIKLGYSIFSGNEIETDFYNFDMLNMDKNHPARDMHDSFYLSNFLEKKLLRTHTSSVQIKAMLKNKSKPFKMISSGKVYRRDKDDDTHSHQFIQLEGFIVDFNINLIHLQETIKIFIENFFDQEQKIRFRPSYFPFTNPSLEVDLIMTDKNNQNNYLEIIGAGMIHPEILKKGNYDPSKYSGFAFGMGIERITMLKYYIKDIRNFYNNDIRFLRQFSE